MGTANDNNVIIRLNISQGSQKLINCSPFFRRKTALLVICLQGYHRGSEVTVP